LDDKTSSALHERKTTNIREAGRLAPKKGVKLNRPRKKLIKGEMGGEKKKEKATKTDDPCKKPSGVATRAVREKPGKNSSRRRGGNPI